MSKRARISMGALLAVLVASLMVFSGSVSAQSGPPPPPIDPVCYPQAGTTIVQPTYPAVPPAGISPVVGPGTIAVIPPTGGNAVSPITTELGGCRGTVIVPADPARTWVVRIQGGLPVDQMPQPVPSEITNAACRFSVDIFDASTGQHAPADLPSTFISALVPGSEPNTMVLVYYDAVKKAWQTVVESLAPTDSVHAGQIGQVRICCVQPEKTTTNSVPKALPNTGGSGGSFSSPLAVMVMVGALVVGSKGWRVSDKRGTR